MATLFVSPKRVFINPYSYSPRILKLFHLEFELFVVSGMNKPGGYLKLLFNIVKIGEVVCTPHDMSPESISCSEALLDSGHGFSERLFAGFAEEASLLNLEEDPFIPNGSILNLYKNMVINCF
jgi:hypothetical protein